jgi:hypothetical protein
VVGTWENEDTDPDWFDDERLPSAAALTAERERRKRSGTAPL